MQTKDLQWKKALRSVLLVLLLFAAGMTKMYAWYEFSAVCSTGQTLYYYVIDTTNHYVALTYPGIDYYDWSGYTKPTGNIILPESVQYNGTTYSVTSISDYTFYGCSGLTSVTIPNSVTTIGSDAFYDCSGFTAVNYTGNIAQWCNIQFDNYTSNPLCYAHNLYLNNELVTDLVIPDNLTEVKAYAFCETTCLTSLTLPNSVTTIGDDAFCGCSGFTGDLIIPNSVTTIGQFAFYRCSGFTGNLIIGNSVTTISGAAFQYCSGFTGVYYSGNIAQWCNIQFGDYASNPLYYAHNLYLNNELVTDLVIPDNVTEVKAYAFCGATCLTSLTLPNSVTSIGDYAFMGCSGLTGSLTIPNSVTTIGEAAFSGCSGFDGNLTIGNSVTTIRRSAFTYCSGFTGDLTIPNSVTTIGRYAFYHCSSFTGTLTIGNSVTTIGDYAFEYCSGFTSVYYTGDITQWCNIQFEGYTSNPLCYAHNLYLNNELVTDLVIPDNLTEVKAYAFCETTCLTSLTLPNSVTTIGDDAFCGCSGFTGSLTIPNSVTTIGGGAFYNCSGFTGSLTIPNSVTTIGESAFSRCSGFTGSLTFPNSVTAIGRSAFSYCSGFNGNLTLSNSVITIEGWTFLYCNGFTGSLTIGNSVTTITGSAFEYCRGFTSMNSLAETPPSVGYNAFDYFNHSMPVTVPCGTMDAYQNAATWNQFTNYEEDCFIHITATANPAEGGTVTGDGSFEEGETCTLIATPNEGYLFENWTKEGNVVSDSTTYSFTVTENADFVANFMEPVTSIDTTIYAEICRGNSYLQNGFEIFYPEVGENQYSITLPSSQGIDSIVNLILTVYPVYFFAEDTSLYNVTSYTWHGNTYTQSGIYYDSLQTVHGCDSVFYLSLQLFNTPSLNVNVSQIDFGEVALNQSESSTLTVSGTVLADNLTIALTGEDALMFSFVKGPDWDDYSGGTITVTFQPTATQYEFHAALVVSSGSLTQSIALSGSVANTYVFNTEVDDDVYAMNTPIPIHGSVVDVLNAPVSNVEVEIGVFVMGMKRSLQATTNGNGEFFATFEPIPSESGYYTVNSGRVGNNSTDIHDHFNIPGVVVVAEGYILCAVTQNQPKTDTIQLRNKSSLPLNINEVSVLSAPEGCSISFLPLSLDSMEIGNLIYTVNGTILTQGNYYQEIKLRVNSDEGATTDFSIWYYCMEPRGILNVTPKNITTTMTKGKSKIIDVMVSNHGTAATGEITIGLPNVEWMSVVGGNTLPSLAVNDSAYFSLRLSPGNDINLTQNTGTIIINCTHGEYADLQYDITAVSDSTGSLFVDVTDEYSYYSIRGPRLADAEVTLTGYYSLETYHPITNADGTFNFENLPEGYYRLHVSAANHDDYDGIIYIDAGMTNEQNVFISYHAVTYSFNVVAGEIQDEYYFILNTTFETNVPAPVITIDAPESIPDFDGSSYNFNYTIINHGLIDAYDVVLHIPEDENFLFTTNLENVDTLHAQDTIVIPCEVTRLTNNTSICKHWVKSWVNYHYTSGPNTIYKNAHDYTLIGTEQCGVTPLPPASGGGSGGSGAPCFGGGGGGGHAQPTNFVQNVPVNTPSGPVNVQVGVQFNQHLVMTREAFFGTFSVHNGFDNAPLSNIGLNFTVKDENGIDCTNLFQINTLSLHNIDSINGNGSLGAGMDGMAQIVFIPTKGAAPTVPKDYYFGGTFTFFDPYFANTLVCDLYPVKLTVHPCPDLYVDYFMQRDILGDDALTLDVVEPTVPAELAVIINNKGAGMAKNVILETAEPMIVENSQGLLINFSIYSTSFNGNEAQLGLMGIPFGNIESGHTAVGEWQFTSSLLGHFVSYEAHVIHNNSYDNPELSLISHLDIHELIHPIRAYGSLEDGINDFLVNDVPDEHNYPDSIYFSNGGRTSVGIVNNISCDGDVTPLDTIVTLTVVPSRAGWNYGVVDDPGGDYVLVSCKRNTDNRIIPLNNVWQTIVTLLDEQDPIYENKLHIVDTVPSTQTVTYTLIYAVNPPEPSHVPIGAIDGLFSVSDSQQVYFSQGNLQYIGSASTPYWKFADNQWDYFGTTTGQNSSSQNVDRDLFGWGTSGWNNGNVYYQPYNTENNGNSGQGYGYGPTDGTSYTYNLTGSYTYADWGMYNSIRNGGNQANRWRTLTTNEWNYVFNTRTTNSGIRYAKACVNNVNGVILLPDDWNTSYYTLNTSNSPIASFNSNTITALQWDILEQHGAVFLPAAGTRVGTSVCNVGNCGNYWSASYYTSYNAYRVYFDNSQLYPQNSGGRCDGYPVRLVKTMQDNATYSINTTSSPAEGGTVTGAGTYNAGEICTLTATANAGYTFTNWTENGSVVSTNANYTFTVTGNRILVANFTYNGTGDHDYVDLGLPSGTLWATCNVGANTPEGYGDYFAWGETQPKDTYNWSTYQYCMGSSNTLTKYCNNSSYGYNGFTDDLFILQTIDDAATVNWGSNWRMPTKEEWQELYQNTTVTWTTQNNVNGRLFTAANGNSVFLPASGVYMDGSLFGLDNDGNYWSSSLYFDNSNTAWGAYFGSNYYNLGYGPERNSGRSVRAVRSTGNTPTGAIKGIFSVSDSKQVLFSQGNLQFQASTSTWRFAEHQWDCLRLENANVSSTYDGWIDLFGWGTSGYNHGAVCYQPWSTSTNGSDYYAYGSSTYNLYDQTGQADWGYNAISNGGNTENLWRTLTRDEWSYLLLNRNTSSGIRFAKAIVNGVEGLVVLPDNWEASYYSLNETNNTSANYSTNVITENDWSSVLEPYGALFLPAGSYRGGTHVENNNPFKGYYWTSSCSNDYAAIRVEFNNTQLMFGNRMRNHGLSVRLARTIQHRFITAGTWSTASNWQGGALPGTNDIVFIDAPCQLDQNATVTALTVSDGQSLTLQSGKTLTVTGNLSNTVATSLVIEDGAQLIHNVANVQATVRKHITPFIGSDDSWHLIALPLTGSSNVESVSNLLEGEYDLYGYDESKTYWKNRKTTGSGFTVLETTKGYLYANGEEVTLGFSGTLENGSATITVPLSFTDGAHLSGFNLIGNPFPCNAYLNREYYVLTTDGTDINPEPIPATTPIPPCTAVFVKAVAEGETVVFTRVAP